MYISATQRSGHQEDADAARAHAGDGEPEGDEPEDEDVDLVAIGELPARRQRLDGAETLDRR